MNRRTVLADSKRTDHPTKARVRVGAALTEEEKRTSIYRGVAIAVVVAAGLWLFLRELRV